LLSGGRSAAGAEQRNFIKRSRKDGPRIMPTGNLRSGSDSAECDRQRRSMQRLTDMADGIGSAGVMVPEAATTREIQQRQANQRRACTSQRGSGRFSTRLFHVPVRLHQPRLLRRPKPHFRCASGNTISMALDRSLVSFLSSISSTVWHKIAVERYPLSCCSLFSFCSRSFTSARIPASTRPVRICVRSAPLLAPLLFRFLLRPVLFVCLTKPSGWTSLRLLS